MPAIDVLAVEYVPLDQLKPDPANPRSITTAELDALTRSIREWGNVQPIVARAADRVVIAGHQRLVAARRLGHATIPVIWLDLSTESGRALGVALNKISGTWDEELLARLLAELDAAPDLERPLLRVPATPTEPSLTLNLTASRFRRAPPTVVHSEWSRRSALWATLTAALRRPGELIRGPPQRAESMDSPARVIR